MSDNGEIEVEAVSGFKVLPKDVIDEVGTIKLLYEMPSQPPAAVPVRGTQADAGIATNGPTMMLRSAIFL